jgi:hypothetical protein
MTAYRKSQAGRPGFAEGIAISIPPVEDHKRPICDGLGTIISYWRGLRGGSQGIFIKII